MASQVCCVDHARPGTKSIGGRWFCDEHYAKATYKRTGAFRSELIAIIALLIFVALVVGIEALVQPALSGTPLLVTSLILAVVPALLWLAFFYLQDRLEPEPVGHVARIFVIGLALAAAVGIPLSDQVFRLGDWANRSGLATFLGNTLVQGAIEAFLVYATVRYFIFDSPEFDERTDGVIYGTAAALGYATALNMQFIIANGGAALGSGEVYVAEVALAHAAFGGLLGYFLGRAKLEDEPVWWLPAGVALFALLNGLFAWLRGTVDTGTISRGMGYVLPSVGGLLIAGALALAVTALVAYLINRDVDRSLTSKQPVSTADPAAHDRTANWAAIGTFVVLLLLGLVVWNRYANATEAFTVANISGAYPDYFSQLDPAAADAEAGTPGQLLRVEDRLGTGAEYTLTELPGTSDAQTASREFRLAREAGFDLYRPAGDFEDTTVGGKPAIRESYVAVAQSALAGGTPPFYEGVNYYVNLGDRTLVVSLAAPTESFADAEAPFERFVRSLRLP